MRSYILRFDNLYSQNLENRVRFFFKNPTLKTIIVEICDNLLMRVLHSYLALILHRSEAEAFSHCHKETNAIDNDRRVRN